MDNFNTYFGLNIRNRIIILFTFLVLLNIGAWLLAFYFFYGYPKLLALSLLAYGFGLRHAVDADHIAAIDNVTRKFMQEKKSPVSVGFFFSLGHSSVVLIMSFMVALGTIYMSEHLSEFQRIGGLIGASVSSVFLLIIAFINFIVFLDIYKVFRGYKKSEVYNDKQLEELYNKKGLFARIFRPLFKFVSKGWHMYIVGFLFGLGFDTASEIALLGISSTQAAAGLSIWVIMIYPLIFMSGMCLIDTLDGVLMLGVYGWAFLTPIRKLFYNMTITLVSFLVAFLIGGLEALCIISDNLELSGGFWSFVNKINNNLGSMGYIIIGIFILSWLISAIIYKYSKLDTI